MDRSERIAGCLLGGAVGDALGAPVEFCSIGEIRARYGDLGIQVFVPEYGRAGAITDDTQMTLFTLEGLLRAAASARHGGAASHVDCVRYAYVRWLGTQGSRLEGEAFDFIYSGWLWRQRDLHSRRGPGNTCLSSLRQHLSLIAREDYHLPDDPINDSKGCGGVMRMAPVGFFDTDHFTTGCELARLTHGHPSGYLAAGFLAHLIRQLMAGKGLEEASLGARGVLVGWPDHQEVLRAVDKALDFARDRQATPDTVADLGEGWVAEEALAISIFCALKAEDFLHGVALAVNHSGDSDSTGAITGNILGAMLGQDAIPREMLEELELRDVIAQMAADAASVDLSEDWLSRYPGG